MASKDGFGIRVEADDLPKVAKALKEEADGKQLRKDLTKSFKDVLEPVRDEARAAILSMPASGAPHDGLPLRQTIAKRTVVEVRMSGRNAGVRLVSRTNTKMRGFRSAAKSTNKGKWRHRVFGTDRWAPQEGKPGWFDLTTLRNRPKYVKAVENVLRDIKLRLIRRGH